jgi:putative membrane protein
MGKTGIKISQWESHTVKTSLPFILTFVQHQGTLLAQARIYEWYWETHSSWGWLWLIGMILLVLLFWGIFILGLVVAVRWIMGKNRAKASDTAMEILRQRYARSEITKEEFEAKKKDLR